MKYSFKIKMYLPLLIIFVAIIMFATIKSIITNQVSFEDFMLDFMAGFFIIFGGFKAYKLSAFAEAYGMYDIIAKRNKIYGLIYPFIEIAIGLAFLARFEIVAVAWVTLVLMTINSIGAYNGIRDKKVLMCACLGTVFKLPMSYVSLGEDLLMIIMALIIIIGI